MSYTPKPQTCVPNPSQTHRRTENILAILPMARILFLMTSLRAAAALAKLLENARIKQNVYFSCHFVVFDFKNYRCNNLNDLVLCILENIRGQIYE